MHNRQLAPAPWKAQLYVNHWWITDAFDEDIAVMQGLYQYDEYNAQLIASVPDLLQACQQVLAILEMADSNPVYCEEIRNVVSGVLNKVNHDSSS